MFEFVVLAVADVFWGSMFSTIGLIVVAWISKGNTKRITSIDEAVNHKETGMPTLVQRVINQDDRGVQLAEELALFRGWMQNSLIAFSKAQGVELPQIPMKVEPTHVQLPKDAKHPQHDPDLNNSPTPPQEPQHGDTDSLTGEVHKG